MRYWAGERVRGHSQFIAYASVKASEIHNNWDGDDDDDHDDDQ